MLITLFLNQFKTVSYTHPTESTTRKLDRWTHATSAPKQTGDLQVSIWVCSLKEKDMPISIGLNICLSDSDGHRKTLSRHPEEQSASEKQKVLPGHEVSSRSSLLSTDFHNFAFRMTIKNKMSYDTINDRIRKSDRNIR